MKKNTPDFSSVRSLHLARQFDEAEAGYLAILRHHPQDVETLHSLGILYAQQENFADAIHYLEKAVRFSPNHPTIQLHLANVLKIQGLFSQAEQLLEKIIAAHPNYVPAFNNLGTVYYAKGKLNEAAEVYYQAIQKQPDYIDAYYNLGLTLAKQEAWEEAIKTYENLLTREPEHFAARFHLACAWMKKDNLAEALEQLLKIEESQPHHFETQTNIATCYLKRGQLDQAKLHYVKALELTPRDPQILFNLGVINMQQGQTDSAIQYYQKAILVNPDLFAAHNNLGVAFLAKQHLAFALHHFQEAVRIQPNNQALHYTINMLTQHQHLLSAPPDYIQSLFDSYADHYDNHLLTALDYQLPQHLEQTIVKTIAPKLSSLDILDLGCGTGLCGALVKPFAKSLVGVDLSQKMLDQAQEKNIYDCLVCSNIQSFLTDKKAEYDLILAGDVLVYIGDLQSVFQKVHQALRPGGVFFFNAEIGEKADYKMNQSGRFSHHKKYLAQLLEQYQFKCLSYQTVVTRMQNNSPVYGHLYALKKRPVP